MALKSGLSIRYKILLLLTLLPLITLTLFLSLAISSFTRDKVAYIFESSSLVSRSIATQFSSNLKSSLIAAKPMIQEYIRLGRFDFITQSFLAADGLVDWVAVFELQGGSAIKVALAERTASVGSQELESLGDMTDILKGAASSGREIRVPFRDERVLLVERAQTPVGEKYFVLMTSMTGVIDAFRSPSVSDLFLVGKNGSVLLGSAGEGGSLLQKVGLDFAAHFQDHEFSDTTEEIKTSRGEPWLASLSKVPLGNLFVITLAPKKAVLMAVEQLLRRSILLYLLLVCITVIVSFFASRNLTRALTNLSVATKRIREGIFDVHVDVTGSDEVAALADSFNSMAGQVSTLMQESADRARMQFELDTARTVQETLFPEDHAEFNSVSIAGHYDSATECGGDLWFYNEMNGLPYIWMGDSAGHGAASALMTSAARSAISIMTTFKDLSPSSALTTLGNSIYACSKERNNMTFIVLCIDPRINLLTYANACNTQPLLIRKEVISRLRQENDSGLQAFNAFREQCKFLPSPPASLLGTRIDQDYPANFMHLFAGDIIILYSDSIIELTNPNGGRFGHRKLLRAVMTALLISSEPTAIRNSIQAELRAFRGDQPLADDTTLVVLRYKN